MSEINFLEMDYEEEAEQFSSCCPNCKEENKRVEIKVDILLDDGIPIKTAECAHCKHKFTIRLDNYFMHKAFHREGEENDSASESEDGGDNSVHGGGSDEE